MKYSDQFRRAVAAAAARHSNQEVQEWCRQLFEAIDSGEEPEIINGYVRHKIPGHYDADSSGKVYEHRLVAAIAAGRRLVGPEEVHHRNEIRHINLPSNLEICADNADHRRRHRKSNRLLKPNRLHRGETDATTDPATSDLPAVRHTPDRPAV